MDNSIKKRVIDEAEYILKTKDTIRGTSKVFDLSKSAVHEDLSTRLKQIDENLFQKVDDIFKNHSATKHLRGGEATRKKYKR